MRLSQQVAEHSKTLEGVETNIGTLQADVDNQMKRKKFENQATRLANRREWLKYELARTEFGQLRKLKEDAEQELSTARQALEPAEEPAGDIQGRGSVLQIEARHVHRQAA